jgi:hypothetical protein
MEFYFPPIISSPLCQNILLSTRSPVPSIYIILLMSDTKIFIYKKLQTKLQFLYFNPYVFK